MFSRLIATIFHFVQPVPGKNNPILWIDKKKCPFLESASWDLVGLVALVKDILHGAPQGHESDWEEYRERFSACDRDLDHKTLGRLCLGVPRSTTNPRVKKYMAELNAQARICQGPRKPTNRLVRVDGTVYVGDIIRRDLTNMLESIFDALGKVVYEDDFLIHEIHIKRRLDRKMPRIELEFHEIEDPVFDEARAKAAKNRKKGWRTKDREKTRQAELGLLSSPPDGDGKGAP